MNGETGGFSSYFGKYLAFFLMFTSWAVIVFLLVMFVVNPKKDKQGIQVAPPSSGTTYNHGGIDETIREADDAVNRSDSIIRYWRSSIFTEGGSKQKQAD